MCLGGDLEEFLTTLDGVHDVLQHQEDAEGTDKEAAFVCTSYGDHLMLSFTTEKQSLGYLLVGNLKAVARRLYCTEAEISVERSSNDERQFT